MKVYAEFFEDKERKIEFRKKTLIQIGDSWDLIGSIVMKNPGSAYPIDIDKNIDEDILNKISSFYNNIDIITKQKNEWYEFSPDATMRQVVKLFKGNYIGKNVKLNGVIQVFNLLYLRNADLGKAIETLKNNNDFLLDNKLVKDEEEFFRDKPVYLGWGNFYTQNTELKEKAKRIFEFVLNKSELNYYNDEMNKNHFYHPGFINIKGKKIDENVLSNFFELFKYKENEVSKYIPYQKKFDVFFDKIKEYYKDKIYEGKNDNSKTIRIELKLKEKILQLTVTKQEEGYCAIRLKDYQQKDEKDEVDKKIILFLKKQGYFEHEVWFGMKKKEELDILDDGEDIFKQITSDINGLKDL